MQGIKYHIVITKDTQHPVAFTIRRNWIYFGIALFIICIACLFYFGFSFFSMHEQIASLKQQISLQSSQKHKQFDIELAKKTTPNFFWKAPKIKTTLNRKKIELSLGKLLVEHDHRHMQVKVDIKNISAKKKPIGGYLFIMLVKHNKLQDEYLTASKLSLAKNGYPKNYKHGKNYWLAGNSSKNFKENFILPDRINEHYEAMVFAYGYKGNLLLKRRIPLKFQVRS